MDSGRHNLSVPTVRIGLLGLVLLCLASPVSGQDAIIGPVISAVRAMQSRIPGDSVFIDLTALSPTQADQVAASVGYPRGAKASVFQCDERRRCHIEGGDAVVTVQEVSALDGTATVYIRMTWESNRLQGRRLTDFSIYRVTLEQVDGQWVVIEIKATAASYDPCLSRPRQTADPIIRDRPFSRTWR